MAIRRKTSEEAGMAAVREVRAFFEAQRAATGEAADSQARGEYLLNSYLLNSAGVEQAFAALPRSVRATFVRFTLEELATLAVHGMPRASAVTFRACCRSSRICYEPASYEPAGPRSFRDLVCLLPVLAAHPEVFSVSFTTSPLKPGTLLKFWCMLRHTQAGESAATRPNLAPAQTHPQSQRRKEVN